MNNEMVRNACERAESLSSAVIDDSLRPLAFSAILKHLLSPVQETSGSAKPEKAEPPEKKTKPQNRTGGLKSRLSALHDQGFFEQARDIKQVADELRVSGWNHQTKEISSRLLDLVRAKKLRRAASAAGKALQYSNW